MAGKYFDIWYNDKQSILETMRRNMQSDLDAGYNPQGFSIRSQRVNIERYEREFDAQMDRFKTMEDDKVERWCYYDLKKRGAIS